MPPPPPGPTVLGPRPREEVAATGTAAGKRRARPVGKQAARAAARGPSDYGRVRYMSDAEYAEAQSALVAAGFSEDQARERLSMIDSFETKGTRDCILGVQFEDAPSASAGEAASSSNAAV